MKSRNTHEEEMKSKTLLVLRQAVQKVKEQFCSGGPRTTPLQHVQSHPEDSKRKISATREEAVRQVCEGSQEGACTHHQGVQGEDQGADVRGQPRRTHQQGSQEGPTKVFRSLRRRPRY